MKAEVLSNKDDKLIVNITGANFETVNSIRRSCLNNVPTMAVEDVQIYSNNSALYDEILAHRLGLIPLTTDLKTYVKQADCKCKGAGCARCTVEFALEAKGPCVVYSRDLITKDKAVKPVFDEMPIVKLFEGQEIKLTAKAVLNTGTYHSKHAPCMAYYQFYPNIKVLKKKKALDDVCPRGVFKDGEVTKESMLKCNLCGACTEAMPESVEIKTSDDKIMLTVESWGQLSALDVYNTAINDNISDLEEFNKQLK
ncbi:MAG: DNA-directed RNA polymerase subunit D [Nanoarchaeota archaeon]|nr:DNA-directed RNA polymerase subunit D [Nanoarchaeota archaeon]